MNLTTGATVKTVPNSTVSKIQRDGTTSLALDPNHLSAKSETVQTVGQSAKENAISSSLKTKPMMMLRKSVKGMAATWRARHHRRKMKPFIR